MEGLLTLMRRMGRRLIKGNRIPLRIALTYAVVALLWILFSDQLIILFVQDPVVLTRLQTIKGFLFVIATALALYVVVRSNVAEIQQSKRVLEISETKYRNLVESINDWVWEVDENGVYTYSSPKVRDILGYRPEEIIGKTPFDLMPEDEARRLRTFFKEAAAERKPFKLLENINIHKDGHRVILETSAIPIIDDAGGFHGYRGIDRDITERKRAEEELKNKERDIRRAYVDVFSAVTGGRLIIMTDDEIREALGVPISDIMHISSFKEMSTARAKLTEVFKANSLSKDTSSDLLLSAAEAITNAVKHAGGGRYQVFRKEDLTQVLVADSGPGIDFKILPKATLLGGFSTKASLGVGFSVMLELCDRVLISTHPGGTTVILEKLREGKKEELEESFAAIT